MWVVYAGTCAFVEYVYRGWATVEWAFPSTSLMVFKIELPGLCGRHPYG